MNHEDKKPNHKSEILSEAADRVTSELNGVAQSALQGVKDVTDKLYPEVKSWANDANEKLHDGIDSARETGEKVKSSAKQYLKNCETYISEQPLKSALIASAIGAVFTAVLLKSRSSHNQDKSGQ